MLFPMASAIRAAESANTARLRPIFFHEFELIFNAPCNSDIRASAAGYGSLIDSLFFSHVLFVDGMIHQAGPSDPGERGDGMLVNLVLAQYMYYLNATDREGICKQ